MEDVPRMRLRQTTDGRSHAGLSGVGADDHHAQPRSVEVNNTSQVIAGGATYNLDIALGTSVAMFCQAALTGGRTQTGGLWREGVNVYATRIASEAIGHGTRDAGIYKSYVMTYSKQNGDARLSPQVFQAATSPVIGIALQDAVLIGSNLRLTFVNTHPTLACTLWVKGRAIIG